MIDVTLTRQRRISYGIRPSILRILDRRPLKLFSTQMEDHEICRIEFRSLGRRPKPSDMGADESPRRPNRAQLDAWNGVEKPMTHTSQHV